MQSTTNRRSTCFLAIALCCAAIVQAAPPRSPELDGRIVEYDGTELRGSFSGSPAWPGVAMSNLYVTWDSTNLYVALQCRPGNDKIAILLDVDPGNGTGATTTTNWVNGNNVLFIYNDPGWRASDHPSAKPFGLDFLIGTEGFYNTLAQVLYDGIQVPNTNIAKRLFDLPDIGNGNVPMGTPIEVVTLEDASSDPRKGLEARIPWSVLYGSNTNRHGVVAPGTTVPAGAVVRLFANIHNNLPNSSFSAPDTIPGQTSTNSGYAAGLLTTDDYLDVVIDQDLDGFPDLATSDVNAPYLAKIIGIAGSTTITGVFNEVVDEATATTAENWLIAGVTISSIEMTAPNRVALHVTSPLPAAGTMLAVETQGIKDPAGNHRNTHDSLFIRTGPYLSSHQTMTAVGTFQGWNPASNNMNRIADYTWMCDVTISSGSGIEFKFAANGSWTTNFGRSTLFASSIPLTDKAGTPGGQNIVITSALNGTYRFVFDERTRSFALAQAGADTDADGLPDEWEIAHGLSPTDNGAFDSINGPTNDVDGDHVSNYEEYHADTDPRDVGSHLFLRSITTGATGQLITFPASTNRLYVVECDNSATASWPAPSQVPFSATGSTMTASSTNSGPAAIHRVRVYLP